MWGRRRGQTQDEGEEEDEGEKALEGEAEKTKRVAYLGAGRRIIDYHNTTHAHTFTHAHTYTYSSCTP